jgi:hypothetical protein
MEWAIGGFKCKWRKLTKRFDFTKEKYNNLFQITTLLINFLHKHQHDFTFEVINEHLNDPAKHG